MVLNQGQNVKHKISPINNAILNHFISWHLIRVFVCLYYFSVCVSADTVTLLERHLVDERVISLTAPLSLFILYSDFFNLESYISYIYYIYMCVRDNQC